VILIVTPNPAIDVTYRVAEQRIGETERVLDVARYPGGKGLNVGRVLVAAGIASRAVLPLGGSSGQWIADALDALGLGHSDVRVTGETRTTVTVVDDRAHPTMLAEPGPAVTAAEWSAVSSTVDRALDRGDVDALVIAGSLPRGADPAVVAHWVASSRAHHVPCVVDCSGPALLAAADAGATVCKPNRSELLAATGADDERQGALRLLDRGAAAVVVSRGPDGIAAHTVDGVVEVPAIAGVSGNPTGAGDAATAGLLAALIRRPGWAAGPAGALDVDAAALRSAAAYGAAAVLSPVAGDIDLAAVERFLAHPDVPQHHDHRTGSTA
jgi:tagatose 6-phosphate kinase